MEDGQDHLDSRTTSFGKAEDSRDEPFGIGTNKSLLRPSPPRGTAFNRRTVVVLVATFGIIFILGILYAFTPSRRDKEDAWEAMGAMERNETGRNSPGYRNTPEAINSIPDTYMKNKALPSEPLTPGIPLDMTKAPLELNSESYIPHQFILPEFKDDSVEEQERKELREAKKSALRFAGPQRRVHSESAGGSDEKSLYLTAEEKALLAAGTLNSGVFNEEKVDYQEQKRQFLEKPKDLSFYARSELKQPISKYEIKASTIIPAVLLTGISSDLPGYMSAQVRENVYDSVSGKYLLIPQGTRLVGLYDSKVNYGQKRVLVVWTRMILPNGKSIDLENMSGIDRHGKSGLKDRVNNHWGRLISGAVFTSLFKAAVNVRAESESDERVTDRELAADGFGDGMMDFGAKLSNKNLDIPPTLEIRPGFKFNLFVHKDFVLEPYLG